MAEKFSGFPKQCAAFFSEIKENNSKIWFEQRREDHENFVMQPAREFVAEMGKRLKEISPKIHADPRVNKSLFKIHRDTRFSRNKTPFKTHMGIMFWEGARKRMECSCYYFHLEPPNLMLGTGIYMFPKQHLQEFRSSVVHPKHGPALVKALKDISQNEAFEIGGKHYKKTPRDFDPDHENAEYLLFNGLTVGTTTKIPQALYSNEIIDYCFERFQKLAPIHKWLAAMTERL